MNKKKQRVEPLQTREEEASERERRIRRRNWAWENNSFINPNLFEEEEEEASECERRFINTDFSATLDSIRGIELPTMHLTNDITWEFNDKDYFATLMQR